MRCYGQDGKMTSLRIEAGGHSLGEALHHFGIEFSAFRDISREGVEFGSFEAIVGVNES